MKKCKVLIISTSFKEKWHKLDLKNTENLSIAYLASYLESVGYDVTMINAFDMNKDNDEVLDYLKGEKYDLIGVSCSPQKLYTVSKDFIKKSRIVYPKAHIVMGGIFPSLAYEKILYDIPELDAVIIGEGEYSLEKVCQKIDNNQNDFEKIDGYACLKNGKLSVCSPIRIENLDALPFPKRVLDKDQYPGKVAYVIAGKGCYGNCSFCSIQSSFGYQRKIYRNPKQIACEIEDLINNYHVNHIQFHDDIFYDYSKYSQSWLNNFIKEIKMKNLKFTFRIYLRPNDVREEEIIRLKEIGLSMVFIGAEAGVQRILDEMNKHVTVEQIKQSVEILKKVGINILLGFITLVPTMSFEELRETYNFIFELDCFSDANLHNRLNIYYGCKYENILREKGLIIESKNFWETVDYKFIDERVALYHNTIRKIREYQNDIREKLNKYIKLIKVSDKNLEMEVIIERIISLIWKKSTQELLTIIENEKDLKIEFIDDKQLENIYKRFDDLDIFISLLDSII